MFNCKPCEPHKTPQKLYLTVFDWYLIGFFEINIGSCKSSYPWILGIVQLSEESVEAASLHTEKIYCENEKNK